VVIPLRDCIARPDEGERRFGLIEHLIAVAQRCGRPDGSPEEKLAFLAGLLHDAAKAAQGWQDYIRGRGDRRPNHAPCGAALFAFWADALVPRWTADRGQRRRLLDQAADWTRIVYDHHGELHDLTALEVPWVQGNPGDDFRDLLAEADCAGLTALVRLFFPESAIDLSGFSDWYVEFDDRWRQRLQFDRHELLRARRGPAGPAALAPLADDGLRLADFGARLIFADRAHAADWDVEYLAPREAARALVPLEAFCGRRAEEAVADGGSPDLVRRRGQLSTAALDAYCRQRDAPLLSLVLPTGCGKTLAGLRIALEACRSGRCRRILYVAPYLSILTQAAGEIQRACGLEVFVHHHLSAAFLEDHQPYDVLETWQVPVLATTFNQLCRALFPRRAQQCLRIPALDGAFVLVDEPQIIDPQVWNLFLKAIERAADRRGCQVLFLTATLPPTAWGLEAEPCCLVPREEAFALGEARYVIRATAEPWDADRLAAEAAACRRSRGSVAVILNTVRDTVEVFERLTRRDAEWLCLTARMLPGHKARIIQRVRARLAAGGPGGASPLGVVSSQVLEAGVDLSFRGLLRARPLFSSVVQAAGRANRHGEGRPAEVRVFPYVRPDGQDSRPWVYREQTARQQTDAVLAAFPELSERDVPGALDSYYREWWSRCPYGASLEMLERAARGEWSAVAGLKPFADDVPQAEVFVPGAEVYLTPEGRRLMERFDLTDSQTILDRLRSPAFRRGLSFRDRKRFSALVRQFTVSVPRATAAEIATPSGVEWLSVLADPARYSDTTGLAFGGSDDTDEGTLTI
jgi:CRISPR-associated endonuclease/helicase Cas3